MGPHDSDVMRELSYIGGIRQLTDNTEGSPPVGGSRRDYTLSPSYMTLSSTG